MFFLSSVTHYIAICADGLAVSEIKAYFQDAPEVQEIVDDVLSALEQQEVITVKGGIVVGTRTAMDMNSSVESLTKFLPRLMKLAGDRVLESAKTNTHKQRKEFARFFVMRDDTETVAEARAIYAKYVAKMRRLIEKSDNELRPSENVRFVGIVGCSLVPEDFI